MATFKKISVSLITLLILLTSLTACGQDSSNPTSVPPAGSTATATVSTGVTATTASSTPVSTATPVVVSTAPAATTAAPRTTAAATTAPTTTTPAQTQGQQTQVPRFEATKCPYTLPKGQVEGQTVRCGNVVVAQEHSQPNNGKTLKLAVAIFKSQNATPASDPIIYLEGGPGGHIQSILDLMTGDFYKAFVARQDAIFFDQRGVGFSQPALNCPEILAQEEKDAPLNLTPKEVSDHSVQSATLCHDRLVSQGINLSDFNTEENAADVNDIRQALGYQQINLYGGSYGTLLAQTVMRLFPQVVRSVILDSVLPPDINADIQAIVSGSRSFNLLFQACASDTTCNKNYPDLKNVFSKTFAKLDANPPSIKVTDSVNGDTFTVRATGSQFVNALFLLLYDTEALPLLPRVIYSVYQGNYTILTSLLAIPFEEEHDFDQGMYNSVTCGEEWAFSQAQDVQAVLKDALPELAQDSDIGVAGSIELCQKWNVKKTDAAQHSLVQSAIPTLVMEGQLDPITPPEYGQRVASKLSKSFYVEFPGNGHGEVVPGNSCGLGLMQAFIASPTTKPDSSCTAGLGIKFQ